jgi:hypothetical protein
VALARFAARAIAVGAAVVVGGGLEGAVSGLGAVAL